MAEKSVRREGRGPSRAEQARRHIEGMDRRFPGEIAAAVASVRAYDATPSVRVIEPRVPQVAVVDEDSVTAVLARGRGLASACDLAVLDFASFLYPGGGYERGAWAQEQALCASSFLYNVLREKGAWYSENRRRNVNCHLYRNRALAVPRVRFERDGYHSYADVIVAAAPDVRRAREEYHVGEDALLRALRDRIRLVMAVADDLGHEKLVLGAFGCGVFGWDAAVVAEAFRAELVRGTHVAREVVFAVPRGRLDENLEVFEHALATFPEANDAPYVSRAERAAAEAERAGANEADEDEDWRQYL
ncbi:MAG TPA: TIGR02452 family protein [Candidatus Olsenella excrementavium]|uniref:TIGR02452 family protein n=1 Tax=Candidatus Olsenella excrementavium TaxID=2838709 RepID=A0A9D2CFK3_9ACTN|nr:TIGR02452 family protein [Candidatus Olsenella excrementavium]